MGRMMILHPAQDDDDEEETSLRFTKISIFVSVPLSELNSTFQPL